MTKYQLRWKTTAAPDSAARTANDPTTGWVEGGDITGTSDTITSLTNGTGYDVQVRANDGQTETGNGWGAWSATQAGTPQGKTYGFTNDVGLVSPPGPLNVSVTLTEAAPTGGLALTLTQLLGTNVPSGVCTGAGVTPVLRRRRPNPRRPPTRCVLPRRTQACAGSVIAVTCHPMYGCRAALFRPVSNYKAVLVR